jgi:3-mercaptopropionate dioxygenase
MIATQTPPATELTTLVDGVRTAVDAHAGWSETALLVAEQLRRHLPTPDVLTYEQRAGSPDGYRSHTLHIEPDGSFSIVALVWRPGQLTRIATTSRGARSVSSKGSSTMSCSTRAAT